MEYWSKEGFDRYVTPSDEALVLQVAKHYFPRYDKEMRESFDESQGPPKQKEGPPSPPRSTATTLGKTVCDYREFFWLANQARKGAHHNSWTKWLQNQVSIKSASKMKQIDWSDLVSGGDV